MSKLLDPKVSENYEKFVQAGAVKVSGVNCGLKEFLSNSERFKPKELNAAIRLNTGFKICE